MPGSRMELHQILKEITPRVYYQPPDNVHLTYPCIVYDRVNVRLAHADNRTYHKWDVYSITYISADPDDPVPDTLLDVPGTAFDRHYTSGNLHHTVVRTTTDRR